MTSITKATLAHKPGVWRSTLFALAILVSVTSTACERAASETHRSAPCALHADLALNLSLGQLMEDTCPDLTGGPAVVSADVIRIEGSGWKNALGEDVSITVRGNATTCDINAVMVIPGSDRPLGRIAYDLTGPVERLRGTLRWSTDQTPSRTSCEMIYAAQGTWGYMNRPAD